MTTLIKIKKECAICGHEQNFTEVASTNRFGHMDLDTRPPEMYRSTLIYRIQFCEECAYSNGNISEPISGINTENVRSKEYRVIADDAEINRHAKAFLLAGHLHAAAKQWSLAGTFRLNAAWVFDDLGEGDNAKRARVKAIENLTKYVEETADVHFGAVIVDVHRRNGEFKEAKKIAEQLIDNGASDIIKEVLELQVKLCIDKDDRCHTVEEIQ